MLLTQLILAILTAACIAAPANLTKRASSVGLYPTADALTRSINRLVFATQRLVAQVANSDNYTDFASLGYTTFCPLANELITALTMAHGLIVDGQRTAAMSQEVVKNLQFMVRNTEYLANLLKNNDQTCDKRLDVLGQTVNEFKSWTAVTGGGSNGTASSESQRPAALSVAFPARQSQMPVSRLSRSATLAPVPLRSQPAQGQRQQGGRQQGQQGGQLGQARPQRPHSQSPRQPTSPSPHPSRSPPQQQQPALRQSQGLQPYPRTSQQGQQGREGNQAGAPSSYVVGARAVERNSGGDNENTRQNVKREINVDTVNVMLDMVTIIARSLKQSVDMDMGLANVNVTGYLDQFICPVSEQLLFTSTKVTELRHQQGSPDQHKITGAKMAVKSWVDDARANNIRCPDCVFDKLEQSTSDYQ